MNEVAAVIPGIKIPMFQRNLPQIQMLFWDLDLKREEVSTKINFFFQEGTKDVEHIIQLDRPPYALQVIVDSGKERWEGSKKIEAREPSITVCLKKSDQNGLFSPIEVEDLKSYEIFAFDLYNLDFSTSEKFSISQEGNSRQKATATFIVDKELHTVKGLNVFKPKSDILNLYKIQLNVVQNGNLIIN